MAFLSQVPSLMAIDAQGDEVLCPVIPQAAAKFPVMDLQVSRSPAPLTAPSVSLQDLSAEISISVGVESLARLTLAQCAPSVFSRFPIA
jgi:hypothetical protein